MAALNDNERTKLLKTHIALYDKWIEFKSAYETAQEEVINYQSVRDRLEFDPKKQKERDAAQREMERLIKIRNTLFVQRDDAHKKFGDFDRKVERDHGCDFYNLMIEKHRAGKTTWN